MEHEEGFYWALTENGWEVAQWANGQWWITGSDSPAGPTYMRKIGPYLKPPEK